MRLVISSGRGGGGGGGDTGGFQFRRRIVSLIFYHERERERQRENCETSFLRARVHLGVLLGFLQRADFGRSNVRNVPPSLVREV